MKISKLISVLEKIKEEYGDIEIVYQRGPLYNKISFPLSSCFIKVKTKKTDPKVLIDL